MIYKSTRHGRVVQFVRELPLNMGRWDVELITLVPSALLATDYIGLKVVIDKEYFIEQYKPTPNPNEIIKEILK